jgi:hypothetical protein
LVGPEVNTDHGIEQGVLDVRAKVGAKGDWWREQVHGRLSPNRHPPCTSTSTPTSTTMADPAPAPIPTAESSTAAAAAAAAVAAATETAAHADDAGAVPTVADLRVKLCYICREESEPGAPADGWVHPCRCTLVAHEACLLDWIRSAQQNRAQARKATVCPQCGAPYELTSARPVALRTFQVVDRAGALAGALTIAGCAGSVVAGMTLGIWAYVRARTLALSLCSRASVMAAR